MPSKIIRDGAVVNDDWTLIDDAQAALPEDGSSKVIVPYALWEANRDSLAQRKPLGIWLDSDESPSLIADDLQHFDVIAINFPAMADGRGFSYARELRQTHDFRGELRAIGDFIRDQLYYLNRCGFNAFALEYGDLEAALASLKDFSTNYQAATDQPRPLFKRL